MVHIQHSQSPNKSSSVVIPKSANRNKSRLLFSSAEMFKKPLWQTVWTQIRLCSGSTLFASILNSSEMLGNYLQQTTSADVIFQIIFFSVHIQHCQSSNKSSYVVISLTGCCGLLSLKQVT